MNKPIFFEDYYNITATTHNENPALMIPIGITDQDQVCGRLTLPKLEQRLPEGRRLENE